ncbi:MAG: hypothetical protein CFE21_16740 [Bacteroidetes bacterium B1(2017)]|nr:MAG: hypothetical protein CFE21_16740 [Bacteroidetes bacterium B1(2017)]
MFSQSLPKKLNQANWQQKVNYSIAVSLNDQTQMLSGFEKIVYTNQSPDKLSEIYMHLWPNAYKTRTSAYAKQDLENGKTKFYFADSSDRGYIDSLDFAINGERAEWQLTKDIDIAIIKLKQPLNPGQSIEISTPFKVKIPAVFSRMGVEDGIYCITQWYPKPAVYDVNGWNPIPYLNQGEFYSEFGSFDVRITLPKNYVCAATGEVQDPQEKVWWEQRSKSVKAEHFATSETKTLRFLQDSVHDFAWFCSKDFMTDKSEVTLSNGHKVETWIFAKSKDEKDKPNGVEYIDEAIQFYSQKVGFYPYSIAQVVITPLKAGAGMEYPTITNCASIDKTTIVHEVGHNWFYGILGSNEREYPWMDESFNTYYENRNGKEGKKQLEPGLKIDPKTIGSMFDQSSLLYKYSARKNMDQNGNLHSMDYTDNNYGCIIYAKNPLAFGYLQAYLGTETFDAMMHAYYDKWKFKHPLPNDFKNLAETFTQKDLSWFFEDVLGSTKKEDYKLVSAKNGSLKIKNKGTLVAPFPVSLMIQDSVFATKWINGFSGTKSFSLDELKLPANKDISNSVYRIDASKQTIDLYRQNNSAGLNGTCTTCSSIKLQPIANLENENSAQVFWSPIYAYNVYNKSMLGLAFYNSIFPQKKNEFIVMPVYSFETKDLNGYAQYWHNWYGKNKIRNIQAGFKSARFATVGNIFNSGDPIIMTFIDSSPSASYTTASTYEKFAPFVTLKLQPSNRRSNIDQEIQVRYVMINEQAKDRGYFYQFAKDYYGVANINYLYKRNDALYPCLFSLDYQAGLHNSSLNRFGAEFKQSLEYSKGKKQASIRLFAGAFLNKQSFSNSTQNISRNVYERAMFTSGGTMGINDYLYDQSMIGRAENGAGFWGHQVLNRDAGFRNFVNLGNTDSWITAANITIPLPIPVPIGVYTDVSICNQYMASNKYEIKTNYVGGVYVQIVKDVAYWYVPLVQSKAVSDAWGLNSNDNFFRHTSFIFNLNKINPISIIRDLKL